ncbi:DUF6268 family outer membrane beta-barrel protein [Parafilimonas sp.]|uniref:DUF6268 family outer membrane beta-barrel protein n=1 Tax=Parafilimonas sp. TaxID=1969739 RepID=UPI003F7CDD1A
MKKFFFGLIFLLIYSASFAQIKITDLRMNTELTPNSHYLMPDATDLQYTKGHTKTPAKTLQSRFNLAINFNLSTKFDSSNNSIKMWSATINTDHLLLDNTGYIDKAFPSSLNASSLTLKRLQTLKNSWAFMGLMTIGMNSDYIKIDGNDLFVFAGLLWIKTFSDKFSLGTGIMVHNSFGKPLPWPLITANWQMGKKYKLNIDAPDQAPGLAYNISFRYIKNEKSDFAVFFRPSNMSYDVNFSAVDRRLLNYWQIPVGVDMRTHYKHLDIIYRIDFMALRSFTYSEKNLEKMFSKYPSHMLTPNISFGVDFRLKF